MQLFVNCVPYLSGYALCTQANIGAPMAWVLSVIEEHPQYMLNLVMYVGSLGRLSRLTSEAHVCHDLAVGRQAYNINFRM